MKLTEDGELCYERALDLLAQYPPLEHPRELAALPVSIIDPYARFYPARLRHFIETIREAMPAAVGSAMRWLTR